MEVIDLLSTIVDFIKDNAVEYFEINVEKDNYYNAYILIDLSNCVNIEIYSNDDDKHFFFFFNTINSNDYCLAITINDKEKLKKILENLATTGYNEIEGGI